MPGAWESASCLKPRRVGATQIYRREDGKWKVAHRRERCTRTRMSSPPRTLESWVDEWEAVDRAAAEYLADRVPGVLDAVSDDAGRWLDALGETISPTAEPSEDELESASAVMALQHADWLGLALGVVHRGPDSTVDPVVVQGDIERLEEVDGEIEDPEGHLAVLGRALLHLTPRWQELGVLDEDLRITDRGAWGLPRALHRVWSDKG